MHPFHAKLFPSCPSAPKYPTVQNNATTQTAQQPTVILQSEMPAGRKMGWREREKEKRTANSRENSSGQLGDHNSSKCDQYLYASVGLCPV